MKVLYIGYYRETSEWGKVTCDNILALDSAGVDVVCRSVVLGSFNQNIHPRIVELEDKSSEGCDVCIQHLFPHDLVVSDVFKKNICIFETDALSIENTSWADQLRLVDEIWVPNQTLCGALEDLMLPSKVVPHCCDYEKYTQKYQDVALPEASGKFKFYIISEFSDIKNVETAVRCFHSEFDRSEQAILIMKLSKFGLSDSQLKEHLDGKIREVKESLRLYSDFNDYPRDIIITESLSEENLCSLHQYCDCFVNVSHGEAWSSTTFDAMAFGSSPICSNIGGPVEYIKDENCGVLVSGSESICKCHDSAFPDTFTGRGYWFEPNEKDIKLSMRNKYETYKNNPIETVREWKLGGLQSASKFTKESIGRKMKEMLNE